MTALLCAQTGTFYQNDLFWTLVEIALEIDLRAHRPVFLEDILNILRLLSVYHTITD